MKIKLTIALIALSTSACVRHIYPHKEKVREYQQAEYAASEDQNTAGSLWSDSSPGLFEDARGRRVGDILTIQIDERSDATRDASTKTARSSSVDVGVSAFFNAMQSIVAANPGLSADQLISATSTADFEGGGSTARSGSLTATLPVRIRNRLPNGDLYVEGTKVLLVNDEESHLYLSGVVRPIDIAPDNSIGSSKLADVQLEYTGRGVISERNSPGWLARLLDYIWPF